VAQLPDGSDVYEVDYILAKQGSGRRCRYLVKWKGFGQWESTWEPTGNLTDAKQKIREYEERMRE